MNVKFGPSNYSAHTLRQRGCTDMVRHGIQSGCIELTTEDGQKRKRKQTLMLVGEIWQN